VKVQLETLRKRLVDLRRRAVEVQALIGAGYNGLSATARILLERSYQANYGSASNGSTPELVEVLPGLTDDDAFDVPEDDPLGWIAFDQSHSLLSTAHWIGSLALPQIDGVLAELKKPGAWAGSAEEIFASRMLDSWVKEQGDPSAVPSIKTLAAWLKASFAWAEIESDNELELTAKRSRKRRMRQRSPPLGG
jgi:hypothetical protein